MSQAIISAVNAAAWAGKSLVDNTVSETGDLIILNNTLASVLVAGISDDQQKGDTRQIINRGTQDVALASEDSAASAKDRFTSAATLTPGQKGFLFYNGTRWEIYAEV